MNWRLNRNSEHRNSTSIASLRSLFSVCLFLMQPIRGLAVESPVLTFHLAVHSPSTGTTNNNDVSELIQRETIFAFAVDSPRSHLCFYSVRQEVTESQNPQSTILGGNVKHCVRQCYGVLTTLIKARIAGEMWGKQCVLGN